ncbi:hypothetical protein BDZ45DRAFT_748310 [Acephala macrosclerotiorum]|nr:hypothetical protein BDZ45DRAFT_748310 [Acephala macrosclerotiorum]
MDLAVSLGFAILLFASTPWINKFWSLRDFSVFNDDNSQIFITKTFYSAQICKARTEQPTHSPRMSMFWDCIGEPILTCLGFAFIELALGKRLSDMRTQASDLILNDMLDLAAAKKLVS